MDIRNISQKWFAEAHPQNYVSGIMTTIGAGANGTITITDIEADALSIEVKIAATANKDLDVAFANDTITVTLGTGADGNPDATKNTAKLIAEAIDNIEDKTWTVEYSGTGATAISAAVAKKAFTAFEIPGTPCMVANTVLYDPTTHTYYVSTEANNTTKNASWKKFQFEDL